MDCLSLRIRGETWVSYPVGMRFPPAFACLYPFRGRGIVSHALYVLNLLRLDRFLLPRGEISLPFDDIACFWPSARRSVGRFYGYRVADGKIMEYIKFGVSDAEKKALRQEAENVGKVCAIQARSFSVPKCLGLEENGGVLAVRYEPLPVDAVNVPLTDVWIERIGKAIEEISAAGYQHGDFGWHNCKVAKGRLWILDWEEMRTDHPGLVDAVSFYAMMWGSNCKLKLPMVWEKLAEKFPGRECDILAALRSMARRRIAYGVELARIGESVLGKIKL